MRKVHLVSSLLMAFTASLFGLGCDSGKKTETTVITKPSPVTTAPSTSVAPTTTDSASTSSTNPANTVATPVPDKPTEKTEVVAKPKKKPSTARVKKTASSGSTTGAGIDEVPGGGTKEKPKAKSDSDSDAKPDENKSEDKKPEDK